MAVQAETPVDMRDMFSGHLIDQQVHKFVGTGLPASHLLVACEVTATEWWRHQYRVMLFGEGPPSPHRCPRVLDELVI